MQLIRGIHNLRAEHRGCVATIGNFDGVHRGHRAVIDALKQRAQEHGLPALLITLEPQPLEFFAPDKAPARLASLGEKLSLIRDAGIDRTLVLKFDGKMASMEAQDFIEKILVEKLGVRHLYVGDDFRFGKGRAGDFEMLKEYGKQHDFAVESLDTVIYEGNRVSSSRIREALAKGDLAEADLCLGRYYSISGRVAHGHKLGRTIGFPTLNIELRRKKSPLLGIYAVTVKGLADEPLPGVANLGNRPVLDGDDHYLLEVHLFDFDREVYGEHVEVVFEHFIRDEMKFDSFELMREKILDDARKAKLLLGCDV